MPSRRGANYALLFAGYLAWLGDTRMAGHVALGTLIGIVGIFVSGRAIDAIGQRREKDEDEPSGG